jgi:hypothetical protein
MSQERTLSVYLNNHLTGATGGVELFRRAAASHSGPHGEELARLRDEVEADRDSLRTIMGRLGVHENRPMQALGWIGEKAARFKPNGYVVRRSPLADVIELEALRAGVHGKLCGWQVLRAAVLHDDRIATVEVETLIERAEDQQARLYKLELQAAQHNLVSRQR